MTKATTTLQVTEKSPATPTKPEAEYEGLVKKADYLVHTFNGQGLKFYWEFGRVIHDLCANAPKYGNRTIETFCDDLKKTNSALQFEKTSLYNAKKFYSLINQELLEKAIAARVTWRGIIDLLSDSITDGQRQTLIQGVASGKYTLSDISARANDIKGKTSTKKAESDVKTTTSAKTSDDEESDNLSEDSDASKEHAKEDSDPVDSKPSASKSSKLELTHAGKVKGIIELLGATADKVEGFGKSITVMLEETTKQKKIDDIVENYNLAQDNFNMLKHRWEKELATAKEAVKRFTGKE